MEKALRKELDELVSQPSVSGVLIADSSGLCIAAEGCASHSSAGLVAALASQAADLRSAGSELPRSESEGVDSSTLPVVVLESDTYQMIIKSSGGITTTIYKSVTPKELREAAVINR